MEYPQQQCAYNTTRESFLALDITVGEFTFAMLEIFLPEFRPKSGAGLWLVPFRGIPSTSAAVPLDLVYLDSDYRVLQVVESFPAFFVPSSSRPAVSVLALPAHSIFSSQTQPGDQLLLCPTEEMNRRLQQLQTGEKYPGLALASPGADEPRVEERRPQETQAPAHADRLLVEPVGRPADPPRNWLQRLLYPKPPDNRQARRHPVPALAAYFFTGGAPQAHAIRDISHTGLYIVTAERWYPGTLIRLTLTNTDNTDAAHERSISVHAQAVRWGNDGVGLQFVVQKSRKGRAGQGKPGDGVDAKVLEEFVERLSSSFRENIAS